MTNNIMKLEGGEENAAAGVHKGKRVGGYDIYDWALYELSCARRVQVNAGIDTSDLREQVVRMLQKDLYDWRGDDLTI